MHGAQDGAGAGEVVACGFQRLAAGAGLGEQLREYGHDQVRDDGFGFDRSLLEAVGVARNACAVRALGAELQRGAGDVADAVAALCALQGLGQIRRASPRHGGEQARDQRGETGGEVGGVRETVGGEQRGDFALAVGGVDEHHRRGDGRGEDCGGRHDGWVAGAPRAGSEGRGDDGERGPRGIQPQRKDPAGRADG